MKSIFVILTFLTAFSALAIRSVGNGGGEAEMIAEEQIKFMPLWVKFCDVNAEICFEDKTSAKQLKQLKANLQKIETIQFVNAADYSTNVDDTTVFVTHESLYIKDADNSDVPKSNLEIAGIVMQQILGNKKPVQIKLDSQGVLHPNRLAAVIADYEKDYMVATIGQNDLHQEVLRQLEANSYQVISATAEGYLVKANDFIYEVVLSMKNGEIDVRAFVTTDDF